VTAVCSTRNVEMVRALGADAVIDYTQTDFVEGGARFDLMFDLVGNRSISECRSVLVRKGTYVPCAGGGGDWVGPIFRIVGMLVTSLFTSQKLKTFIVSPNQDDLLVVKKLVEAGKVKPVIERRFPLSNVADALRHVGEGHTRGQTIVQIAG